MTTVMEAPHRQALIGLPRPQVRPWLVLVVLGIAQLMLVLDATVVNIALPRAQESLGFSDSSRQWIVTAYSLSFGSLLFIGGRLSDMFGRKRIFVLGLIGFAAASALGGLSVSFPMLVAARALQGAFGAMLAPASLSFLTATFTEPKARARAFGFFGAISAAGASVGLVVGGALTEYVNWRWVMFVNVGIVAAALIGAVPGLKGEDAPRHRMRLDVPGALLGATAVFSIVFGFSHAATRQGIGAALDPVTVSMVAVGLVLLVAFVLVERRTRNPLLPMRIVLDRDRGGAYVAMFLSAIGVFGILLFLTYYLETVLGYSPIRAGLAFLPMTGLVIVVGGIGNAMLASRFSARAMVPTGLLLAGAGMAMLTRISVEPHYASTVLPGTLVMALGLGLVFAPCFNIGTQGVDESDTGIASAAIHVAQQVGGSIGTALLNTIATTVASSYVVAHAAGSPLHLVRAQAAVHSYAVVFWVSAAAFGVAAVIVAGLFIRRTDVGRIAVYRALPA